jgi:signal transduction histidine kinase
MSDGAPHAAYRAVFQAARSAAWVLEGASQRVVDANEAAVRIHGCTREELVGDALRRPSPEGLVRGPWRHRRKDGTWVDLEIECVPFEDAGRTYVVVLAEDVSERRQLEERCLHAQKMASLGRMAGGVAHDFNNLLSVILSYASLVRAGLRADDPAGEDVAEIERAGRRAAELTKQLLALSRRRDDELELIDLAEPLVRMERMKPAARGAKTLRDRRNRSVFSRRFAKRAR